MNPCRVSQFAEFRALLRNCHGAQEQVARVAGLTPSRLSNCLNPLMKHTMTVDEFFACLGAALSLDLPGFRSFADSIIDGLRAGEAVPTGLDGCWNDEPLEAIDALVHLLREYGHTPKGADLPQGARDTITAEINRVQEVLDRCKRELSA